MATAMISMAGNDEPCPASLLGIASELRQKILEHVFAGSVVHLTRQGNDEDHDIMTNLQIGVMSVSKQLRNEGQNMLTSATALDIFRVNDWIETVPVDVAKLYLPKIQYVSFDLSCTSSTGFDFHQLPSLKVLRVRGAGYIWPVPDQIQFQVDKSIWLRLRDGNIDEEAFLKSWYNYAFEQKRRQEAQSEKTLGPFNNMTWLLDVFNNDVDTPFQLIVESRSLGGLFYVSDPSTPEKTSPKLIVVCFLNSYGLDLADHEH